MDTFEETPEEKIKCAILRILNLSSLRLFGCLIYNFKINCIDSNTIIQKAQIHADNLQLNKIKDIDEFKEKIKGFLQTKLTANVHISNGSPVINIYSHFIEEHTVQELTFVLLHEILHFLGGDCIQTDGLDPAIMNLANDHIINKNLIEDINNNILDSKKISTPPDTFLIPELQKKNLNKYEIYDWMMQSIKNKETVGVDIPSNLPSNLPSPSNNQEKPNQESKENNNQQQSDLNNEDSKDENSKDDEKNNDEKDNKKDDVEKDDDENKKESDFKDSESTDETKDDKSEDETKEEESEDDKLDEEPKEQLDDDLEDLDEPIDDEFLDGTIDPLEFEETIKLSVNTLNLNGNNIVNISDISPSSSLEAKLIVDQIKSEARIALENIIPNQRGTVSGSVFELIKDMVKVEMPWDKLLDKAICSKIVPDDDSKTWSKILKRPMALGMLFAGNENQEIPAYLVIACDTSGSISTVDLEKFSSIILQSSKYFDMIRIIKHDVKITSDNTIESQSLVNEDIIFKFEGRGGTSHLYVFQKIEKLYEDENSEISLVILLTDFYSDVERIWSKFEWVKEIPICVCLTEDNSNHVPEYVDANPIIIQKK